MNLAKKASPKRVTREKPKIRYMEVGSDFVPIASTLPAAWPIATFAQLYGSPHIIVQIKKCLKKPTGRIEPRP